MATIWILIGIKAYTLPRVVMQNVIPSTTVKSSSSGGSRSSVQSVTPSISARTRSRNSSSKGDQLKPDRIRQQSHRNTHQYVTGNINQEVQSGFVSGSIANTTQRISIWNQRSAFNVQNIRNKSCEICSRLGTPKNAVKPVAADILHFFPQMRAQQRHAAVTVRPYENIYLAKESFPIKGNCITIVHYCFRNRSFSELGKLERKEKTMRSAGKKIPGDLQENIDRLIKSINRENHRPDERNVVPKVFLWHSVSPVPCSDYHTSIYGPTRMLNRNSANISMWFDLYSSAVGISRLKAEEKY